MKDFQPDLDEVTLRAMARDVSWLSGYLEVPVILLSFSLKCVGDGLRKGRVDVRGASLQVTHFAHMCRVCFFMKRFFPEDRFGRFLAIVHDVKEEALPGREASWYEANEVAGIEGLSEAICLLTEEEVVRPIDYGIPREFDKGYILKYRNFLTVLRGVWGYIGNLELCDRFDATSSFDYLDDRQYSARRKYKALETFGRIWATVSLSKEPIVEAIKDRCRVCFSRFGVSESEVEQVARYFETKS